MVNKVIVTGSGKKSDPYRVNAIGTSTLKRMYEAEKLSIPAIARLLNWPRSRTRQILLSAGITMRTRKDGIRLCPVLGQHMSGRSRLFTETHKNNIAKARLAWSAANALGLTHKPSGYVQITIGPNKGRYLHDVIMESHLGRHLKIDEVVHHIDGNRSNNNLMNLRLMARADHARLHQQKGN